MNKVFISHVGAHGVNLGIGIVVPAYKILEVINRPELKLMRQEVHRTTDTQKRSGVTQLNPKNKNRSSRKRISRLH